MTTKFSAKKTQRFYFQNSSGKRKSYVLIFGDEVETLNTPAPSSGEYVAVSYRGRSGEIKNPSLIPKRSLEMYFLDVGQGDAAFIVTPNNTKILVDGGLKDRALGFLIWKYHLHQPGNSVSIDYMILSHADKDHVEGLIPVLKHPKISVANIIHNGIGSFDSGFNTTLGNVVNDQLITLHNHTSDLQNLQLSQEYGKWISAVITSQANYFSVDSATGIVDIGDSEIELEILGPRKESNGTLEWFSDRAHTINGHSVVFRIVYDKVRAFFSGDLNVQGSKNLLKDPSLASKLDSHVFKSPHHGSHEFHQALFEKIAPQITVVSSGDSPDHGHPRSLFLGGVGKAGRGKEPLIFSTEIAATFVDAGDQEAVDGALIDEPITLGDLDFSTSDANITARRRFKKTLPGIINVRTDGTKMYAMRRVNAGYQWESYGPIDPVDKD